MSLGEPRKTIAIFREKLLPYSETFINNQAVSLERYTPEFVSFERIPNSIEPPVATNILMDQLNIGRHDVQALKLLGRVPAKWCAHLKTRRFNLLHAHFGPDALWALPLADQLNLPLIVTFHGYDLVPTQRPLSRAYRYYQWRRKKIFNKAKAVLAVSDFVKTKLIEAGCPSKKIIVHYIGVNLEEFRPVPTRREPIVLYVGRLIEQKGILDLVRAMSEVLPVHPQARVVVIGSGAMEEQARIEADRLGIPCDFLGVQSAAQVRFWMNKAALLCVPARHEAFGLVYAEAQAMRLPVVAYAHSGVSEAVLNNVSGMLSAPGNLSELSRNISLLLDDSYLGDEMGSLGRKRMEDYFDIHKQTQLLEKVYDQVLENGKVDSK